MRIRRVLIVILAAGTLRAFAGSAPADQPAKEAAPAEVPAYAGSETCEACHADQAESYGKTPHAAALAASTRPESERGCEACHGPGQAHVDAGGGKGVGGIRSFASTVPATRRSAPCLTCHGGDKTRHDFSGGEHAKSGVACTDCHDPHNGKGEAMLAKPMPQLCYGCHPAVRAKFALTEHHKVDEGVVSCLDCHQPHGSRSPRLLRDANDRTCFRCHGDLEGPFVFEHVPVTSEGCQRCHDPHGTVNRHLLIRQQVTQLCYECHTVTPPTHVQPSFRDCTRCHVGIHGSNTDPHLLEQ
jgi:DmsE family decaheme c-type cytochrome